STRTEPVAGSTAGDAPATDASRDGTCAHAQASAQSAATAADRRPGRWWMAGMASPGCGRTDRWPDSRQLRRVAKLAPARGHCEDAPGSIGARRTVDMGSSMRAWARGWWLCLLSLLAGAAAASVPQLPQPRQVSVIDGLPSNRVN